MLKLAKQQLKIGEPLPDILIQLFNITDVISSSTIRHSNVINFSVEGSELHVRVTLPNIAKTAAILKADPFTFREKLDGKLCEFHYVGHDYALSNSSSKCVRPLTDSEIIDDVVVGIGCLKRTLNNTKMYEARNCKKITSSIKRPAIQLKHDGRKLRINCQEYNITMNGVTMGCPN